MKKILFVLVFNVFLVSFVEAATYHIDPSAGASGDGSASSPFKAWTDLPSMQTGDDVYFKCGTTLYPSSELKIKWEGEESDRVVIGAYYMDGNTPVYGVSGNKPVISGNNNTVPKPDQDPPIYVGLIHIRDKDYITIENLSIEESRGDGIRFEGNVRDGKTCKYFIVDNCNIINGYMAGIRVNRCAENNGIIRNNYLAYNCLAGNWNMKLYRSHPAVITVRDCPRANILIERNTCFQNYGESYLIGARDYARYAESGHAIIQDNFDLGEGLSYFAGVEHIIYRRNVIIGGNWRGYEKFGGVTFQRPAIGIGNEDQAGSDIDTDTTNNIEIYNNLIADVSVAVWFGTQYPADTMHNIKIYNNTIIAAYRTFKDNSNGRITFSDCFLKNNAIYNPPGTVYDSTPSNLVDKPGWTVEYNGGTGPPLGSPWIPEDSHWIDPLGADWQTIDEYEILNILPVYFNYLPESKLKNAGVTLDEEYAFDYFNTPRFQGTGWDIGAFEMTELVNAGFESGNDGSWTLGNNCNIVDNSSQAHTGSHSLSLAADGRWHAARQSVDLVDFHIYKIEGHLRSDNIAGQAPRFRLRWYDEGNSLLLTERISGASGTTCYLPYDLITLPPVRSVRLEVAPQVSANTTSGNAWYDDIAVVDLDEQPIFYTLTVDPGNGSGAYPEGTVVNISAHPLPTGMVFDQWTGDVGAVADVDKASTTLTMPASNVTIAATFLNSLLINGDFETGDDGSWALGNNCSIDEVSTEAYKESYSLRITADGSWHAARQSVDVEDDHEYEIKGYMRSDNIVGQGPRFRLRWYDAGNSLLLTEIISGVAGTTDYLPYNFIFTPPANSVRLEIAPQVSANTTSGTAWFDDIAVIDLDE